MTDKQDNDITDDQETAFDWKKTGFDKNERLTLKINVKAAEAYNAKKDKPMKAPRPENLSLGLKKLRKKIKEVYDEDDDDDENETIFAPIPYAQEEENTLLNALTEDEKRLFKQKDTIKNTQMQQNAGKMEALHIANNLARESGLRDISKKAVALGMQEAVFRPEEMQEKIIKKEVSGKLGIKGKIEDGKIIQAARGIKKVENLGGKEAAKNLDMRDIVKAGEAKLDDIKLAELILEKSGQDVKKRKQKLNKSKENIELKHLKQPTKKPKKAVKRDKDFDFSR